MSSHSHDRFEQQVAPRLRDAEGHLVLHAALVELNAKAVGLAGPSGVGKSTLSACLSRAGWTLFGDDTLEIDQDSNGVTARALFSTLRLNPDSSVALDLGDLPGGEVDSAGKHVFRRDAPAMSEPARLAAIVILSPGEAHASPELEQLSPAASCMQIVENSFAKAPNDYAAAARRLERAAHMAAVVPVFRIRYRHDYEQLSDVSATLIDALLCDRSDAMVRR